MKFQLRNKNIFFFVLSLFLCFGATSWAQCPTVVNANQSFCDLQSVLVSDLVATDNGNGVIWYQTPTSTTPLSPMTGLVNNGVYYADDASGSCGTRQSVTVRIYGPPSGISTQGDCYPADGIATIANLSATGNNVQWYNVPSGGTPLPSNTVLVNESIYYASQTNPDTGCESSRLSVYVSNTFAPTPTGPAIQEFCNTPGNPPTIADLVASGANKWYATASSAVALNPNTPLVNGQSYFATTVVQQCESIDRLQITVVLVTPHNSGSNGSLELCQNTTGSSYNLFEELGGTPETNGTWSGPVIVMNGHLGTLDTTLLTASGSPYIFTYTVSSAVCASSTSTVTVTILPLPVVSIAADTTICAGSNATVMFTGTPGATVSYTINGGPVQNIVLNGSGLGSFTNTYSESTTISLLSVTSAGPTPCTQSANGSVTITVLPLPTITLDSNTSACMGGAATILFTGTPNSTATYTVNGGANQTILLNASGSASITQNYTSTTVYTLVSAASTGSPACSQPQSDTATVTVIPVPAASIGSNISICPGSSATVNFNGTPNATVSYTINNGPVQTITLNSAGTAAVTNTYTTTTTFTLTGVATGGSLSCPAPASGTMTINVLPLPVAAISQNTTICLGQSATVTFTGTPGATVSYTINGGPVQTIVLNASGIAEVTNTYTATTIFTVISVSSAGSPSCSQPQNASMTILVSPLPTVAISQNTTICAGSSATVTFAGTPNSTVTYTINGGSNQQIVLNAEGLASITGTYSATTTFTLVGISTNAGCSQTQSGQVVITVIPPPVATISGNTNVCPGDAATVTFNGTPNATLSYTVNNGPVQTIVLDANGTAAITTTFDETTIFTITGISTSGSTICSQAVSESITITVLPLPVVSVSQNTIICSGQSATVTFTGTPNATITYTENNGPIQTIILDSAGTGAITSTYNSTTTYNVISATSAGSPACSQPQTASMTITVVPLPVITVASNTAICPGESATVAFTGNPNAIVTYTINGGSLQTIQLDALGTAAITNTYDVTTVFELISATLPAQGCSQPQNGTVTITVSPIPVVNISGNASICSGEEATITFTGTPNTTVEYTINGGPVQSIVIGETGSTAITQIFTETTTFVLVGATTNGSPSCTGPATGVVVITIVPPPMAAISASTTVCAGENATVTFTGTPNAVVTYNVNNGQNQTIQLNNAGIATITSAFTSTTVYTLISAALSGSSTCSQQVSGSITITVIPFPVVSLSQNVTICSGSEASVIFTGTPNATVSYTVNGGSPQSIILNNSGNATITANYSVTTIFSLISAISDILPCSQPQSGTMIINVVQPPVAAIEIIGGNSVCSGQSGSVVITGTPNAIVTYTVNGGQNQTVVLNASGTATITNTLFSTTTYVLISATTAGAASCSAPQTGTVTLIVTPIPMAGADVASVAFCTDYGLQDLFLLLGPNAQEGGTWFPVLTNGDGFFDPATDPAGTYIYTVSGTAPCPDDTASVTITIVTPPNPGVDDLANLCANADPQDLFVLLGSTAQQGGYWTPALSGGVGIFNPAVDVPGTYFYTIPGSGPCEDQTASITVTVVPGPDAGLDGTLVLCVDSAPQNLFAALNGTPSAGGTWSPALASGSGIFNPAVDTAGVYTYTFTGNQPCENDTATVTVTVNPIPDAGTDGSVLFCTNHLPADLFLDLNGSPQSGGTWSPPLASGSGVFNPLIDPAGVYTYSVGGGFCSIDTASVTVTVTQSPNAGGNGATLQIDTCFNIVSVDLFTGLNGTQAPGTWNDDDNTGALTNNIFNPSIVGPGTYHFTYTVGGGVSPCLFDTATVTVIVDPTPNAGTFSGVQNVCSSVGTFDLATLLTNAQSGGTWTDGNGASVVNPIDISAYAAGQYSFTYRIDNACGIDTEIVQINVLANPGFTNANITVTSPVCIGNSAIVNFAGLPDGSYTLNYNLSGGNPGPPQTILLTISGGVGTLFVTPAMLSNTGSTTINFNTILNNLTGCSATLTNVLLNFIVSPQSNLAGATIAVSDVCLGSAVPVQITNAVGLPDGNYQFNYTISNLTPGNGSSGIVSIAGGIGTFAIPASTFSAAGSHTLTINNIISLSGCSNFNVNVDASFNILDVANASGAIVSAANTCVNSSTNILISGADNIPDGSYTIGYVLSGATSATLSSTVNFVGGSATISIPANLLSNQGTVTVTFASILGSAACGFTGTLFNTVSFAISNLSTPVLIRQGEEFCAADNPTIADLSANIEGTPDITWYDTINGGTAYNSSDPLVHGQTYYGALVASECQNSGRLPVTVDLTICDNLLIPDGFSPNGDNVNDQFVIVDLPVLYPKFSLEIYNRYGSILYKGNINTGNWDGRSSAGGLKAGGDVVPTGVYFFILQFNDGIRAPVQGRLYLSR